MKKVLIISELSQASPRIPGISRYLLDSGWQPVILSGNTSEEIDTRVKIIRVPYSNSIASFKKMLGLDLNREFQEQIGIPIFFRKKKKSLIDSFINFVKEIILYPDEARKWTPFAIKEGVRIIENEKINAIISVSPPVSTHIIAKNLKQKFKTPWVADLQDLWTQNHYYQYSRVRKFFEQKLEVNTLKEANVLITVSSPLVEQLKELHKRDSVFVITNGFDPERVNIPSVELTNKFTITYTGSLYSGKQNPSKLFIALKGLIANKKINPNDIEVRFYGPKKEWLTKEIEDYQLSAIVKQYGLIPREASLQKQRESQILLLLNWEDKRIKGVYTGKVFEYLGAQRPILVIGGYRGDVVEKLIQETNAGFFCPKIENIKTALKEFYFEYKRNGSIAFHGNWEEIRKYSHGEMAKKFADVLNQITL
jgi:hypothetical protein